MNEQINSAFTSREIHLHQIQQGEIFGSWVLDLKTRRMQWSEEVYRIFGIQRRGVTLTPELILNFVHREDREYVKKSVDEALRKGQRYNLEYRICRSDGAERFLHAVGDVYLNRDLQPTMMAGTLYDVTESKKIFHRLIESEDKFRGLLETAYDAILVVDEKGVIDFANRQSKTWLGYRPDELVGKQIEHIIPDRFHFSHLTSRNEYIQNPTLRPMGRNLALYAKKKDGSEFPVEVSLSPFTTPGGTLVTAFLRDMTDQKRAENQQKFLADTTLVLSQTLDYQERIQRITNLVVPTLADWCSVYIYDQDKLSLRSLAQSNEKNIDLTQQLAKSVCLLRDDNKRSFSSIAKSGVPHLIENLNDDVLRELTLGDESCLRQFKDLKVQSLIIMPMSARGRIIGIICLARCQPLFYSQKDLAYANLIAERSALAIDNARLYQEAQNAIRLREDILAIVSHDLKNPLGIVRGYNELMAEDFNATQFEKQKALKLTDAIARSVRQMERLIGDLLDFAKIESGTLSIEAQACDLKQLIAESVESVQRHAQQKKSQVQVEIQTQISKVFCDPDRIKQVLVNLLGNAIKFVPEKGSVKLKATDRDSFIEFGITDNGPGISKENLPHLFERYWQAKETAKLGTGLGLAIVKGLVECHRGHVWAESSVGVGSTFYFTLLVSGDGGIQ